MFGAEFVLESDHKTFTFMQYVKASNNKMGAETSCTALELWLYVVRIWKQDYLSK